MQTVNFSCGHCGNLMAVALELLGQHVRCPHCQQVVVAPAAAPASVPPPPPPPVQPEPGPYSFSSPATHEEDIFTPKEVHEDLFADTKPATLEIPAEPSWPAGPSSAPPPDPAPPPAPHPELVSVTPGPDSLAFGATANHAAEVLPLLPTDADGAVHTDSGTRLAAEAPLSADERPAVHRVKEGGNGAVIVLIFLVPYALLMTGVAIYFYWNAAQQHHPLEFLPDWPGEHPGATKKGQGKVGSVYDRVTPESPLPASLKVGLRKTLRVGSLEVTPERVERKRVTFCYERHAHDNATSNADALVLTLHLRNVSRDEVFYPTDPAFDARWNPGQSKPYTFLEVGSQKFFGGAMEWPTDRPREYIQGQEFDNQPLQPGTQRDTVICTDPSKSEVMKALQKNNGPLLWRVRLRRGLERYKDREICCSAVIGVEFTPRDIEAVRKSRN